jgi:hypothetical protein
MTIWLTEIQYIMYLKGSWSAYRTAVLEQFWRAA